MQLKEFDYALPENLIAEKPANPRDSSRLLVLEKDSGKVRHCVFRELPEYLGPGDCLVLNKTKVRKARLPGKKQTGGKAELLLLNPVNNNSVSDTELSESDGSGALWKALCQKARSGTVLDFPEGLQARLLEKDTEGAWLCEFSKDHIEEYLERHGEMPLPHYILQARKGAGTGSGLYGPQRRAQASSAEDAGQRDEESYQTVYADETGSVAAPTAGLHFTEGLLEKIRQKGIEIAEITLHVGWGTFKPVFSEDVADHKMLPEAYQIPREALAKIEKAQREKKRIAAVGTTSTRTLETWARTGRTEGNSDIFIYPGFEFKAVQALVTNFHLPKSTPLLLACAFAGKENLLKAYQEAIEKGYRFYSYGDAMLIL